MRQFPASPDLGHLKKQAKHLLRDARAGDDDALRRFREGLPAARKGTLAPDGIRLHDAQSVIAREYGFASWTALHRYVGWKRSTRADRLKAWLGLVFDGMARERALAVRIWREEPDLFAGDPWLAAVTGDETALRAALDRDAGFANRPGGPQAMPPLVALTHSGLIREDGFAAPLLACARLLIARGADVNGAWNDPRFPDNPLSALYGAAGRTHHAGMTQLLLDAGANPNDNESLYHAMESRDPACARLLLAAGARVAGSNAIGRVLDYDRLDALKLLLQNGGNAAEHPWIHHAILRGRSLAHIEALAAAGADLRATDQAGVSLYRWASLHGRTDVLALLASHGVSEPLSETEAFVAAAARGDLAAAQAALAAAPDLLPRLSEAQLQTMPHLAAIGAIAGVRTMLTLGWPREVKAAWHATALNLAVFQGDAAMARLLLEQGADWQTPHGFGDTVLGTLSFASQAEDIADPAPRDYAGCAAALLRHGVPAAAFAAYGFSDEVLAVLAAE